MPGPTLASLILGAAKDIERVGGTLDAELLLSTLLGSGYSRLAPDRGAGLDALVAEIREAAAEHPVAALLDGRRPARTCTPPTSPRSYPRRSPSWPTAGWPGAASPCCPTMRDRPPSRPPSATSSSRSSSPHRRPGWPV